MGQLGTEVILAHSPQAKGRVERGFRTHQDRLVKKLRMDGISTMEDGNKFLREVYIQKHNRRYAVEPAQPTDVHIPLLSSHDLDAILSIHEDRQVYNDSVVRIDNRFLLLEPTMACALERRSSSRNVSTARCGSRCSGRYFGFEEVQARPHVPEQLRRRKRLPTIPVAPRLPRNIFFVGGGASASIGMIAPEVPA